ncbi:MAG TPA: hypothetical protein VM370_11835 [Candidatus Thermoplasmatota archaeon]|nr:hypothetical protein [Candidatus Thermoplasmatota archaeon]
MEDLEDLRSALGQEGVVAFDPGVEGRCDEDEGDAGGERGEGCGVGFLVLREGWWLS